MTMQKTMNAIMKVVTEKMELRKACVDTGLDNMANAYAEEISGIVDVIAAIAHISRSQAWEVVMDWQEANC